MHVYKRACFQSMKNVAKIGRQKVNILQQHEFSFCKFLAFYWNYLLFCSGQSGQIMTVCAEQISDVDLL